MADVKRCDQTGEVADDTNPAGWLRISIRPYGLGVDRTLSGDVAGAAAAVEWVKARLAELAADRKIAPGAE